MSDTPTQPFSISVSFHPISSSWPPLGPGRAGQGRAACFIMDGFRILGTRTQSYMKCPGLSAVKLFCTGTAYFCFSYHIKSWSVDWLAMLTRACDYDCASYS